ncbi:MAG: TRAP transporter small permease [Rhodopirellula sp. JB044]|uniref:TRAP transporter small permease n=1 Tax=Rhodopirellula sp. JB044 TaxID=3342844 RepID=UPI00370CE30A
MHQHVKRIVQALTKLLQWLLIAAMAMLVIDVVWGVVTRYVGGEQASWTEELARFLLIWVALLGGAVAFETKRHLGVDYFVGKFDPSVRRWVSVFAYVVVLFFAVSIFVVGGVRVVYDALMLDQTTPALGWKMGHVYMVVPIAGCFMSIFTIDHLIASVRGDDDAPQKAD